MNADRACFLAAVVLPLAACTSAVTPEKFSLIKPNMTPSQVEAILGRPTGIEQSESLDQLVNAEVDHYPAPEGEGRVTFVNKTVFKAEFVQGTKS